MSFFSVRGTPYRAGIIGCVSGAKRKPHKARHTAKDTKRAKATATRCTHNGRAPKTQRLNDAKDTQRQQGENPHKTHKQQTPKNAP